MMLSAEWLHVAVALALALGLLLVLAGHLLRRCRGLGGGRTVSLDRVTPTSYRLGLTGRPDRLIKAGGNIIVEEWKSARVRQPQHRAQMGVYFLLVEEELHIRPSHGVVVIMSENSDGTFTGTFAGDSHVRGCVTAFGIQFSANWNEPDVLPFSFGAGIDALDRVHHVDYSGSLSASGAGYTTSGTMNTDAYWGYTDPSTGVCTAMKVPGFPLHDWQSSSAHGSFHS
jgi:hypothetical protein